MLPLLHSRRFLLLLPSKPSDIQSPPISGFLVCRHHPFPQFESAGPPDTAPSEQPPRKPPSVPCYGSGSWFPVIKTFGNHVLTPSKKTIGFHHLTASLTCMVCAPFRSVKPSKPVTRRTPLISQSKKPAAMRLTIYVASATCRCPRQSKVELRT